MLFYMLKLLFVAKLWFEFYSKCKMVWFRPLAYLTEILISLIFCMFGNDSFKIKEVMVPIKNIYVYAYTIWIIQTSFTLYVIIQNRGAEEKNGVHWYNWIERFIVINHQWFSYCKLLLLNAYSINTLYYWRHLLICITK